MRARAEFEIPVENRVVWMTCGQDLGYQVVLAPRFQQIEWPDLFEAAFPHFEIGRASLRWKTLTVDNQAALAVAFYDPEHCDASSRPIKHFLIFLHIDEKMIPLAPRLNTPRLLAQLAPGFETVLRADRRRPPREVARQVQNTLADQTLTLDFTAKPAMNPDTPGGVDPAGREALRFPAALWWALLIIILIAAGAGLAMRHHAGP